MDDPKDTTLNYADPASGSDRMADELEKTSPENIDQLGKLGSESDPEVATATDTFEDAKNMGLYPDANEDLPEPVGSHNSD